MEILSVILTSLLSVAVLFLLARLIGYRQVSELSLLDYVNGITIGSIAAELALSPLADVWRPLIATVLYGVVTVLFSVISDKSLKARRLVTGNPVVLFRCGKFHKENFRKEHLDLGEFLMQCREMGYFDLCEVDTILLEPNGKLSILPLSTQRQVKPSDLSLTPPEDEIPGNVILDGKVMSENLQAMGYDETWLRKMLGKNHAPSVGEIFLATATRSGTLSVFPICEKKEKDTLG